ncbi:ferrous iron transport protein B [uncultured Veillonella sp.]|uniref:ferrous iron transport protein B n=1 Tax=uncultured Veillonella sp. TaxID=159268 RepID=UPI0025DFD6E2|nr:ferrous iron transport protein B [uncultured Veillonella sp.]
MSDQTATTIRIALAGNPNCGKTTIFNNITGSKQHVGNYPGVTVEKKEGECKFNGSDLLFIDLPGTYSLTARSLDELVARNTIINDEPDVIVNVLDASNLERNLYLAAQLIELERPLVLALNMSDVAEEMGINIDVKKLSELTGASIVKTVGRNNVGTKELLQAVVDVTKQEDIQLATVNYGDLLEPAIQKLVTKIEEAGTISYPIRWVAIKLLENDHDVVNKVKVFENTEAILIEADALRAELSGKVDLEIIFQEYRHRFAVATFNECLQGEAKELETKSDRIDKVLTHRVLGLPIFLGIMWLLFNFVNEIGAYPQGWIEDAFAALGTWATTVIPEGQLQSLVVDGIIAGVGAVMSFVPLIVLLFLGIAFLEDTGYMARAAFVMDRVMRACGLHGKSFIPLLIGYGCSIPAIMGARILDNRRDRMITILVSQFMTCSARLPVYTLFIGAFFPVGQRGTALFAIYLAGIVLAVIMAKIFRKFLFPGESEPFVMELPPYHMPTLKSVLLHMWERAVLYLKKAGTFILAASVIIWFLASYPQDVQYSQDFDAARETVTQTYDAKADSILAQAGLTTDEQKEPVMNLVDQMTAIQEEQDAAAEEEGAEEEAAEATTAEATADETTEATNDASVVEVPEYFKGLEADNAALFPVAWSIYQNDLAKDEEIGEIDELQAAEKIQGSYAAMIGRTIEPIMRPLGFDWKMSVSLITALAAKEVMVSTLGTIYAVTADEENEQPLQEYLRQDESFTPLVAIGLMMFVLIYPPCFAAMAVFKREAGGWAWLGFFILYSCALAWGAAFLVYHVGHLLGFQ